MLIGMYGKVCVPSAPVCLVSVMPIGIHLAFKLIKIYFALFLQ